MPPHPLPLRAVDRKRPGPFLLTGPLTARAGAALAALLAERREAEWFLLLDEGEDPRALLRTLATVPRGVRLWFGQAAADTRAAQEALSALMQHALPRPFLLLSPEARGVDLEEAGWRRCPLCCGAGARPSPEAEVCLLCSACLGRGERETPFPEALILFRPEAAIPVLLPASAGKEGGPWVVFPSKTFMSPHNSP